MQITVQSLVAAPPDTVFTVAIDITRWPQFISGIQSVELLTSGPVTVGTRFRETRIMFGRQATEEMTIAEIERPQRFLLTAFNHGTAYRAEHIFEPDAAGTRMRLIFKGRPATPLARLFAPLGFLFQGTIRRQLTADLDHLKREAELRHGERSA